MASNTLVYLGHYETSFHRLRPNQTRYWRKNDRDDDEGVAIELPPEKFRGGIRFGFMQTTGGFVIVSVDALLLPAPVMFIGGRHGPNAPGPAWSEIDQASTLCILADAIVTNPGFRDHLIELACRSAG